MQAQRQIQVGDVFEDKSNSHHKVKVVALSLTNGEVTVECCTSHIRVAFSFSTLNQCYNLSMLPLVGDRYLDSVGDMYEITYVEKSGDVEMRSVGPHGPGPTFHVAESSLGRLFHAAAGFPPGGGYKGAQHQGLASVAGAGQGLAAWIPDPLLPPGQSNEFFGVDMNNMLTNKCTCGIDSIGGGKHSDWCDKHEKEEKP